MGFDLGNFVNSIPGVGDATGMLGLTGNAGGDENQAALDAWKKLLAGANVQYQNPDDTFHQQAQALDTLKQQSQTGLTDQDKFAFWQARQQAGDFAQQGEGAAQQQAAMQGGGVATGGRDAVMQAQAAQQGANRLMGADMNQAGQASQRRYQATLNYMQGLAGLGNQQFRNANALNQFNQQNFGNQLASTAGMSGQYGQMANWQQQRQNDAKESGSNLFNMGSNAYGSMQKKKPPGAGDYSSGYDGGGLAGYTGGGDAMAGAAAL